MKMLVTKVALATSVALATLIAAESASAQPVREAHDAQWNRTAPEAYDAEANPNYKFGPRVTVKPGDVISGDSVIGRDPDPFIRDQLLREYDSGRPD
jgi:hypothetical protein